MHELDKEKMMSKDVDLMFENLDKEMKAEFEKIEQQDKVRIENIIEYSIIGILVGVLLVKKFKK